MQYGLEDVTYKAVGSYDGLVQLVDKFYAAMHTLPEAKRIRDMHPDDLAVTKDKLVYFLSGWMGGPRIYPEKYGNGLSLPMAHQHLKVTADDAKAWLMCMQAALEATDYPKELKAPLNNSCIVKLHPKRTIPTLKI